MTDRDKDRVADEVKEFAPSISFAVPNGVCFSKDGFLFVAEQNRVLLSRRSSSTKGQMSRPSSWCRRASSSHRRKNPTTTPPGSAASDRMTSSTSLGQPFNVFAPDKMDLYKRTGISGIVRMSREGKDREVFAWGVRNSVGMDFNRDRTLWFTDNQVDGMGDDQPPASSTAPTSPAQLASHTMAAARLAPTSTRISRRRPT